MSINQLTNLFHVYFGLSERDTIKWHLLCRYRGKISGRLIRELNRLENKARKESKRRFEEVSKLPNPFLKLIKKDEIWTGGTWVIPLKS